MQPFQNLNPWPRMPWKFGQGSFPPEYQYGLLLPQRTLRTIAYLPRAAERMVLGYNKIPFWHVQDFVLDPQDTQDGNSTPTENFWALSVMATSKEVVDDAIVDGNFRAKAFQLTDNSGTGARLASTGVDNQNFAGTAGLPMMLRTPAALPNNMALLTRVANKDTEQNKVQLAFYGVKDLEAVGAVPTTD